MSRRTFTASLWRVGDQPFSTDFEADDSIQAAAIAMQWAKGHDFTLAKYSKRPKPDGKTYSGTIGPTKKDAFIQIYEVSPIVIMRKTP